MSSADLTEGFNALLEASGITLTLDAQEFIALLSRGGNPENDSYVLSPSDDSKLILRALRNDLPATPRLGLSFADSSGGNYRVTRVIPRPHSPIAHMECEYVGQQ